MNAAQRPPIKFHIPTYFCHSLQPIRIYCLSTAVFVLGGLILLLSLPPYTVTAWANAHNNTVFDMFFSTWTYLAEWPMIVAALLSCFYLDRRYGLASSLLFGLQALLVQGIKLYVNANRPFMTLGDSLHKVPGVEILSHNSFPSGHTAAAFLAMGLLSMNVRSGGLQVLFACMAAGIGYSRMYLGQHFLADVLAGASIALIFLMLYQRLLPRILRLIPGGKHRS